MSAIFNKALAEADAASKKVVDTYVDLLFQAF